MIMLLLLLLESTINQEKKKVFAYNMVRLCEFQFYAFDDTQKRQYIGEIKSFNFVDNIYIVYWKQH